MATQGRNTASGERIDPLIRRRSLNMAYIISISNWVSVICLISVPMSLFAIKLGAGALMIGIIAFIINCSGLYQPLAMAAIERKGKKAIIAFGWKISLYSSIAIVALPVLALIYPDSHRLLIWGIIVLIVIRGFGEGIGGAGWFPLLQDNVPSRITGKFFAKLRTYWQTAGLITTLIIAVLLGSKSSWWKFSVIFLVGVIVKMVSNFAILKMWQRDPSGKIDKSISIVDKFKDAFSYPPMRTFILFVMTFNFTAAMVAPFQVKMLANLGYSNGFIIAATSMTALGAIVSLKFWGRLTDKYGNRAVHSFASIWFIFMTLAWIIVDTNVFSSVYIFLLYFLSSVVGSGCGIATTRYMMHSVPKDKQDNIVIINTMSSVSLALGPLVGGIFLHVTNGFTIYSGALRLNNYHMFFIISALLFLVPYSMRKKFRVAKEPATSDVIAMLARPRRPIWETFVLVNSSKSSSNKKRDKRKSKNEESLDEE